MLAVSLQRSPGLLFMTAQMLASCLASQSLFRFPQERQSHQIFGDFFFFFFYLSEDSGGPSHGAAPNISFLILSLSFSLSSLPLSSQIHPGASCGVTSRTPASAPSFYPKAGRVFPNEGKRSLGGILLPRANQICFRRLITLAIITPQE